MLVKDEFTQQPGNLEHALATRATYDRERCHDLRCADYARPKTNYASLPHVITTNDPLQFPQGPTTPTLMADTENQNKKDRGAQSMLDKQGFAYELKATMRLRDDPILTDILEKMGCPAEDRNNLRLTSRK